MALPPEMIGLPARIGEALTDMRDRAGMSGKDLALTLGWDATKVSRVQNGRTKPSPSDVLAWAKATGASDAASQAVLAMIEDFDSAKRDWRRKMGRGQLAVQKAHTDWAANAQRIRYFDTVYVPGWLQTREYIHRVLSEMVTLHSLPIDDVDAAVAQRLQRQQMLYDDSKQFDLLIVEPVLRYLLVPPAAMRAQLDRLQTAVDLPNVRFGIIPMGVPLSTTPQNSFQLYDDFAVVESFAGEDEIDDEEGAAKYAKVMDLMWEEAVTGPAARRLIISAADALP